MPQDNNKKETIVKILSKSKISVLAAAVCSTLLLSCNKQANDNILIQQTTDSSADKNALLTIIEDKKSRLNIYFPVTLSADISHLSVNQK
jgi:hypothetical protein